MFSTQTHTHEMVIIDMMEESAKAMVVIILQHNSVAINTLYILHLHNVICQLCLNKTEIKKELCT